MVPAFSVFPEYSTYFMFAQNSKLEVDRTFSMSSLPGVKKQPEILAIFVLFLFFFCLLDIELCITRIEYGCWFYNGLRYILTEHSFFCFVNRLFYNIVLKHSKLCIFSFLKYLHNIFTHSIFLWKVPAWF